MGEGKMKRELAEKGLTVVDGGKTRRPPVLEAVTFLVPKDTLDILREGHALLASFNLAPASFEDLLKAAMLRGTAEFLDTQHAVLRQWQTEQAAKDTPPSIEVTKEPEPEPVLPQVCEDPWHYIQPRIGVRCQVCGGSRVMAGSSC